MKIDIDALRTLYVDHPDPYFITATSTEPGMPYMAGLACKGKYVSEQGPLHTVVDVYNAVPALPELLDAAEKVIAAARTCVDSMRGAYGGGTLDDLELVLSAYDASHGDVAT